MYQLTALPLLHYKLSTTLYSIATGLAGFGIKGYATWRSLVRGSCYRPQIYIQCVSLDSLSLFLDNRMKLGESQETHTLPNDEDLLDNLTSLVIEI